MKNTLSLIEAQAHVEFARLVVQGAILVGAPEAVQDHLLAANDRALALYMAAVREVGLDADEALAAYAADWEAAAQDVFAHHGEADWD